MGRSLLLALAIGTGGCAAETAGSEPVEAKVTTDTTDPTIFGGEKDDDDGESGVVALRVGAGSTFELCSGALIAPNLVLTARHCVTHNATTSVSCDDNGKSANGAHVTGDEDPSTIGIYLGASPSFSKAPVAMARAVVAPTGPYLCDSDIALVVLETAIDDVKPLAIRQHRAASKGELVRAVGYGQNDKSAPIGTRFRKSGVAVLAQGSGVSPSKTPLGPHEFEVGRSICQGDSGGPAISEETGAVIGVVSRGGGCNDDFGHIYTTTGGFDQLFADAFRLAGAEPTAEQGDVGSVGASTRSKSTGFNGEPDSDPSASSGGCSMAAGATDAGTRTGGGAFLAAAAALVALRSRRRRAE